MSKILFADHYRDIGGSSVFSEIDILKTFAVMGRYATEHLIPSFIQNPVLSYGIFLGSLLYLVRYRDSVEWKKIVFFLTFGGCLTFIVYLFRIPWGLRHLLASRYDAAPVIMVSFIYALLLNPFLRDKYTLLKGKGQPAFYALCVLLVVWAGSNRYLLGKRLDDLAYGECRLFYSTYHDGFTNFIRELKPGQKVTVQNAYIKSPSQFLRYPRTLSFFAQYVLTKEVRDKIYWDKATEPKFLIYLEQNNLNNQYKILIDLLKTDPAQGTP